MIVVHQIVVVSQINNIAECKSSSWRSISIKKYKINKSLSLLANNCFQCPIFYLFILSLCLQVCLFSQSDVGCFPDSTETASLWALLCSRSRPNCLIQLSKEAGFTRVAWMTRSPFISYCQSFRLMHRQQPKPCIITDKSTHGESCLGECWLNLR
jgi:hypothetical protein